MSTSNTFTSSLVDEIADSRFSGSYAPASDTSVGTWTSTADYYSYRANRESNPSAYSWSNATIATTPSSSTNTGW